MSSEAAVAFIDRIEADEAFAERIASLRGDQAAVLGAIRDAGFDTSPEEVKVAVVARYGTELTPEQLDAIAGGADIDWGIALGTAAGVTLLVGFALAAAF